jgi:hypothetical protein
MLTFDGDDIFYFITLRVFEDLPLADLGGIKFTFPFLEFEANDDVGGIIELFYKLE